MHPTIFVLYLYSTKFRLSKHFEVFLIVSWSYIRSARAVDNRSCGQLCTQFLSKWFFFVLIAMNKKWELCFERFTIRASSTSSEKISYETRFPRVFRLPSKVDDSSLSCATCRTLSIYLSDVFYGSSPLLRVSSSPRSQCHHQLIYSWRVSFILDDSSWILVLDVVCTRKRLLGASLGGLMSVTQSHRFRHCSGRFFFSF